MIRILEYKRPCKLKFEALKLIVSLLSLKELLPIKMTFYAINSSLSGTISLEEFNHAFRANGFLQKERGDDIAEKLYYSLVFNDEKRLTYTEFCVAALDT
jgi:hypothetical protein